MDCRFFFINTYDSISESTITQLINSHPDMKCQTSDLSLPANVEHFIDTNLADNKICGNIKSYTAFELQHKILVEKTRYPLRKVTLVLSPRLRINFLLNGWLKTGESFEAALNALKQKHEVQRANNHSLFALYHFDYFYEHILHSAQLDKTINLNDAKTNLFLYALAYTITFDSADLPTPSKFFCFEKVVNQENDLFEFISYLSSNQIVLTDEYKNILKTQQNHINESIKQIPDSFSQPWQDKLLEKYLNLRLKTIYYPNIDKPLLSFYASLGYTFSFDKIHADLVSAPLISIQLNSNRPAQLVAYFDNIEETADHPEEIEVLINIDTGDNYMETLLKRESQERKFTIKYITTPKPTSFCDLWQPINQLLKITHPDAYFLLNISDEMLFATQGWDTLLKKYKGYFPDHLFRLRASRNKLRNYFDRWECSFAQDAIPITTKKWIDIGGNWNPCFGPDSFQQLISFYLAKESIFANKNYLREVPIYNITFHGDIPGLGIDQEKVWKLNRDHIKAMQVCQSYAMQLEARRRAMLIKATIIAEENQILDFEIIDNKKIKTIQLLDKTTRKMIKVNYNVNRMAIFFTNQYRKLRFNAYFGGGKEARKFLVLSFGGYLRSKYASFNQFYLFLRTVFLKARAFIR